MLLVVLILTLCAVYVVWWLHAKHRRSSPPVYPGALPLIGHAHKMLGGALQLWQKEKQLYEYCSENGGVIEIQLGPIPVYVITDLEDSLTVANTCLDKPYIYNFGKDLYDRGLVTTNGIIWKNNRKLLNPAFNQQILNTFVQEYCTQARCLISELAHEVGKDPFDIKPYLFNVLKSVYKTIIGGQRNDNGIEETLKTYAHETDSYFDLIGIRFAAVFLHLQFIFNMSSMKRKQDKIIKTLKNITEMIISKRESERDQKSNADSLKKATQGYETLLDRLLDEGTQNHTFTNEEIREHLDTIVAAAYDTSSRGILFSLILIGSYPDVQERIFKELQEVLDYSDRDLSRHDLPKLVYLEAVLKETLRLYAPVPRIGRCTQSAVKLKNYTLPAGRTVAISLYGINRHPMWGADANEFRPERWLDPATLPDNVLATFSFGKRNCVGKQYAMMVMKTTLAYILRRYRVTGDISNVQFKCDLMLKSLSGHNISLDLRT